MSNRKWKLFVGALAVVNLVLDGLLFALGKPVTFREFISDIQILAIMAWFWFETESSI